MINNILVKAFSYKLFISHKLFKLREIFNCGKIMFNIHFYDFYELFSKKIIYAFIYFIKFTLTINSKKKIFNF